MIPKRIIYCWFGGEMADLNKMCIKSWERVCPDYEIVRIDETNFDPSSHSYSKKAYEMGNWSFVSDIARVQALKDLGGFYLDTDVELRRNLDMLRNHAAVITELACGFFGSSVIGYDRKCTFPKLLEDAYVGIDDGSPIHCNINNLAFKMYDLHGQNYVRFDDVGFYGVEYFANKRQPVTEKTIAIHHEQNSWVKSWTGAFKPMADFVPFDVNGKRCKLLSGEPVGNIELEPGIELSLDILELGNYFKNGLVTGVDGNGFRFRRYGVPLGVPKVIENGVTLYHV